MSCQPILIVEDEAFLAMDIEHILLGGAYSAAGIAADRDEAMAAARSARIAFVGLNPRDGRTGPAIACELAGHHGITVAHVTANPSQPTRIPIPFQPSPPVVPGCIPVNSYQHAL